MPLVTPLQPLYLLVISPQLESCQHFCPGCPRGLDPDCSLCCVFLDSKRKPSARLFQNDRNGDVITCGITSLLLDVILYQCFSPAGRVLILSLGTNFAFQRTWTDKCQSCCSQQLSFKPREQRKLTLKPLIYGFKPEEFKLR